MVAKGEPSVAQSVQKDWSVGLICGIIIMSIVYMRCTPATENETLLHIVLVTPIVTVLLAAYLFVYRGSNSRTARAVFIVFVLLSLLVLAGFMYIVALGSAFRN